MIESFQSQTSEAENSHERDEIALRSYALEITFMRACPLHTIHAASLLYSIVLKLTAIIRQVYVCTCTLA